MKRNHTFRLLVLATSHKTRGGITSVIKSHQKGGQWKAFHCCWLETHIDRAYGWKLLYMIKSLVLYVFILPFYDLIHIHVSEPSSAIRKGVFMLLAHLMRKKTIVHFHSFSPETTIQGKFQKVYGYLFKTADVVITLSDYWKKEVDKKFHLQNKTMVLFNPCAKISHTRSVYSKKKLILYAGAINNRKGYADLIKAFSEIADKYPDWQIIFAGDGDIKQGEDLTECLGIRRQVIFLGWVNGAVKDKIFKESTIFCLPSYAEGFPMAVLDAWAYGLPVISTPVGGLPDIAKDGDNIMLFNPGDITGLVQCLDKMISDDGLRNKIAMESCRLAEEAFNEEIINKQLGCIYEMVLTEKKV